MMQLQQFSSSDDLNQDFAQRLVGILQRAISERGAAYLVVSGGRTPQALFKALSHVELAWDKVTVLLADDRWLDDEQSDSNERLVKATLLQNKAAAAKFISLYSNTASAFDGAATVLERITALPTFDAVILGMGEDDINVHDQWACESMGAIQNRTREHLGTSDKVIIANRRILAKAIDDVAAGKVPPGFANADVATSRIGPDTVDGIAPAHNWQTWATNAMQAKRDAAPWNASLTQAE